MREQEAHAIEQTILGAILIDNTKLAMWQVTKTDFGHPFHRHLFELIESQAKTCGASVVTIAPLVVDDHPIDDTPAAEYVRRLPNSACDATPGINRMLRECAARRTLAEIGTNLNAAARDYRVPLAGVSASVIDQINTAISGVISQNTKFTFKDAGANVMAEMDNPSVSRAISTGLTDVDRKTGGGVRPGENILIAGATAMGKSLVETGVLLRMARAGHGVMLFSLEMTADQILRRCLCDIAFTKDNPISFGKLRDTNLLSEHEKRRIRDAYAAWKNTPMIIEQATSLTISEIAARARAQKLAWEAEGKSLDVIGIDHLLLVKPANNYRDNRTAQVGEISTGVMALAKDLDVAVIAAQQINRAPEQRDNKRPQLSDLRDSGQLEQNANMVWLLYREAYHLERLRGKDDDQEGARQERLQQVKNVIEINVAKQREGPVGTIDCYCHPGASVIRNLDYGGSK